MVDASPHENTTPFERFPDAPESPIVNDEPPATQGTAVCSVLVWPLHGAPDLHLGKALGANPVRDLRTRSEVEASNHGGGNLHPVVAVVADSAAVGAQGQEVFLLPPPRPDDAPPVGPPAQQESRPGTQFPPLGAHRFLVVRGDR
jgi:hypothetical protein